MTELVLAWTALALSIASLALSAYALRRVRVTVGLRGVHREPDIYSWADAHDLFPGYTGLPPGGDEGRD